MAEHRQNDKCLSYINISLQKLNTFDDYEGDDLVTRFADWKAVKATIICFTGCNVLCA